jgi:hypothetical protein
MRGRGGVKEDTEKRVWENIGMWLVHDKGEEELPCGIHTLQYSAADVELGYSMD